MPEVTYGSSIIRLLHDLDDLGIALRPFVTARLFAVAKTAAKLGLLFGRQIMIAKEDHLVVK